MPSWPAVQALANALGVSGEAFNRPPAERPPQARSCPPKASVAAKPKRPKRKEK
jgi:hypothetical protein